MGWYSRMKAAQKKYEGLKRKAAGEAKTKAAKLIEPLEEMAVEFPDAVSSAVKNLIAKLGIETKAKPGRKPGTQSTGKKPGRKRRNYVTPTVIEAVKKVLGTGKSGGKKIGTIASETNVKKEVVAAVLKNIGAKKSGSKNTTVYFL